MQVQRLDIAQQQKLKMTPQLIQSIRLMTMPAVELRERIAEELERNPALELTAPSPAERHEIEYSLPDGTASEGVAEAYFTGEPDTQYPDTAYQDVSYTESSRSSSRGAEASDAHQMFIEGALSRSESLQEHLLAQLPELPLSAEVSELAAMIIQNLDSRGFHLVPPETLIPVRRQLLDEALDAVRRLDPVGTGCADFQESLIFQARYYDDAPPLALSILRDHIDVLEKPRPEIVARKLKVSREEAEEALDFIRTLEPFPGSCFDSRSSDYIIPDVTVRKGEDGFIAVINDEDIPVLGISPLFMELSQDKQGNAETRDFVRESVKEARWFIGSINQRNHTLLKVVRMLIIFQEDFFLNGPAHLHALRLQDVAVEIGVHEATVSRIAGGKYLQCHWGLFELKYFFSSGVYRKGSVPNTLYPMRNDAGENQGRGSGPPSREAVKQILKEIIRREGTLSDRELSEKLAEQGISVARRTVAKYRTELTIGSSFDR